jgi:hypothetical protein
VGDTVIVAALVNWNATLIVISPRRFALRTKTPDRQGEPITSTVSFRFTSAATITGSITPTITIT